MKKVFPVTFALAVLSLLTFMSVFSFINCFRRGLDQISTTGLIASFANLGICVFIGYASTKLLRHNMPYFHYHVTGTAIVTTLFAIGYFYLFQ